MWSVWRRCPLIVCVEGWGVQVLGLPLALVERLAWDTALFLAAYAVYTLIYSPGG